MRAKSVRTGMHLVLALSMAQAAGAGCAARTKPSEIVILEILRRDKILSQPAQTAFALLAGADDLLLNAESEWDRGHDEAAIRAATMGQIKMKTALAILEAERARTRLTVLDVQLSEAQAQSARLSDEAAMIDEEISIVQRLRLAEKGVSEERKSLSSQSEAVKRQAASERQRLAADLAAERRHVEALDALRGADLSLKTAETVDAPKYAKAKYAAASEMLQLTHKEFDAGNWDATIAKAAVSRGEAEASISVASPLYERASQVTQTRARDRALEAAATGLVGVRTNLERDGDRQRLVLVLRDLFADKQTVVVPRGAPVLDGVRDLLTKYPTYPLQITGYTDDQGKPTELNALSLARANAVYWALVTRGVEPKRILVDGKGAEDPVADNTVASGRAKNARIEISLLYHIFEP